MAPSIELDDYVQRKVKRGKEYFYFRKVVEQNEFRRPLPHPFADGYKHAYESAWMDCFGVPVEIKSSGTSIADLCCRYRQHYLTSKKAGELPYYKNRALELLKSKWARFETSDIKPIHMQALYDQLCDKPQVANRLFDDISATFQWAIPRGFTEINPAMAVDRIDAGESYEPWPIKAIEVFIAKAQWHLCRAFLVALYTGQRRGDILSMRFRDIEGDVWNLKQGKSGNRVPVPLHPIVASIVADEWEWGTGQGIIDRSRPVLRNTRNQPWGKGFGASWRKEMIRLELRPKTLADMPEGEARLTYHGLRTTNATIIASEVAKHPEKFGGIDRVQSLLGHHSKRMSEHYARRAEQEHLNADSVVLIPDFGNRQENLGTGGGKNIK